MPHCRRFKAKFGLTFRKDCTTTDVISSHVSLQFVVVLKQNPSCAHVTRASERPSAFCLRLGPKLASRLAPRRQNSSSDALVMCEVKVAHEGDRGRPRVAQDAHSIIKNDNLSQFFGLVH